MNESAATLDRDVAVPQRPLERGGSRRAEAGYAPRSHDPDALNVVFCGTGSPLPTPERGAPCIAVYAGDDLLMLDVGGGAASRLAVLRAPLGKLSAVLLTHFHSDHIGGLGDLVLQSWAAGRRAPLLVYGPEGVEHVTEGFVTAFALDASYRTAHHGPELMPERGARLTARPVLAWTTAPCIRPMAIASTTVGAP
jgi:ribonuclease Z